MRIFSREKVLLSSFEMSAVQTVPAHESMVLTEASGPVSYGAGN